jgi:hypothetical protein
VAAVVKRAIVINSAIRTDEALICVNPLAVMCGHHSFGSLVPNDGPHLMSIGRGGPKGGSLCAFVFSRAW